MNTRLGCYFENIQVFLDDSLESDVNVIRIISMEEYIAFQLHFFYFSRSLFT